MIEEKQREVVMNKVILMRRLQTGGYTNCDGQKIYTTDVVVEDNMKISRCS